MQILHDILRQLNDIRKRLEMVERRQQPVSAGSLVSKANTWTNNQSISSAATSGSSLSVTRNLAAASTDSPVVNIHQDNSGDDQPALQVRQDGSGNILQLLDGANTVLVVTDGGRMGIRQSEPEATLDILTEAISSNREYILRAKVSDAGDDAFYIANATIVNSRFLPWFVGHRAGSNVGAAATFTGSILDTLDSGSDPVFLIQCYQTDGDPITGTFSPIAVRPIFRLLNHGVTVLTVSANGDVAIGSHTPQGKLHIHDGTSGKLFATKTNVDGTVQTFIPDGPGDVTKYLIGEVIVSQGTGVNATTGFALYPGGTESFPLGSGTWTFAISVGGAFTVSRTAGSGTADITVDVIWQ